MKGRTWLLCILASTASWHFTACSPSKTEELGKVADCDNGSYFSLAAGECQALRGHSLVHDPMGFDRVEVENGITVPQLVNGRTPFTVSFTYEVSRPSSFDIVVKRVEYGSVLNDNYSNWEKVTVDPGKGEAKVRLYPKDGKPMPAGKANNFIEGSWQADVGYIVEVRGGDRFEDEDADSIDLWRAAGLEINEQAPDDPAAKALILGDISVAGAFVSCAAIEGQLQVVKSDEDLTLVMGLKEPGSNWKSWGEQILAIPQGSKGPLDFKFATQDSEGKCPPPGGPISVDPWKAEPGQYVLQLDIYDREGEQIKLDENALHGVRSSIGIEILPPVAAALREPKPEAAPPSRVSEPSEAAETEVDDSQLFRLSDLQIDKTVASCGEVKVDIEVHQTDLDLSLTAALKQPGDNWVSWGSQTLNVAAGSQGQIMSFRFKAQDDQGRCAPPGAAVSAKNPSDAKPGQYLIQLDIFDRDGKKYDDPNASSYALVRNWAGVKVAKSRHR